MVAVRGPRPEGAPYYPDRVAISHTTSDVVVERLAVSGVPDDTTVEVFVCHGSAAEVARWELGLQGAFLDPELPA